MPVKKRAAKKRDHAITAAAVDAYRNGNWTELHRALGLKPWQSSPRDAWGEYPSWLSANSHDDWDLAAGLRAELEAQGGEADAS
jgi:hypothetical protein